MPGREFDPVDLCLVRTDAERTLAVVTLGQLADEVKARTGKPDWYETLGNEPSAGTTNPI